MILTSFIFWSQQKNLQCLCPCIDTRLLFQNPARESRLLSLTSSLLQGCSSPLVVKLADTQRDKEQRRLQQQLVQQIQQLNNASTWGNLAGLGSLTPQYLAVSAAHNGLVRIILVQLRFLMYMF